MNTIRITTKNRNQIKSKLTQNKVKKERKKTTGFKNEIWKPINFYKLLWNHEIWINFEPQILITCGWFVICFL